MKKAALAGTTAGTPDKCADSSSVQESVGGFGTTGNNRRLLRMNHRGTCTKHHIGY